MAPTYSFPILGNHEIISCLGELDIPLTEQDLLKPHPDTLYRAYEEMVVLLCGESREAMYAPELDAADVLEFPELYEEAIGNLPTPLDVILAHFWTSRCQKYPFYSISKVLNNYWFCMRFGPPDPRRFLLGDV